MVKKISALMCALLVLVGGVFTTSFQSKASSYDFYLNYPEPSTTDNQGYLTLFMQSKSSGDVGIFTFFWNMIGVNSVGSMNVSAYISISSTTLTIRPYGLLNNNATVSMSVADYDFYGQLWFQTVSSTQAYSWNFANDYILKGYRYAGNVASFDSYYGGISDFSVSFNQDGTSMLLLSLIEALYSCKDIDVDILHTVQSILSSVDGVENQLSSVINYLKSVDSELDSIRSELQLIYQKADALLLEQKASNTWLEKIYNFFAEKDEKDKEQAQTQGDTSVSQGTASIEDKGAGFADSMGGLVSSMSYSGTECAWTFPQVKLPAIDGVMEERVLIEEQPIDFTRWINAIPAPMLLLIQSLLTIGLIVYCFKELYDTISYVLTLRGGGSNE